MSKKIVIYEKCIFCIIPTNLRIDLTGRWKIKSINSGPYELYLEKKLRSGGFYINTSDPWIHENDIVIEVIEEYINDCQR